MSNDKLSEKKYIWKYKGYDNGSLIYPTDEWRELAIDKSRACEFAFQNGNEEFSTNGGEYQFNIKKMEFYVIDFSFVSDPIQLKRVLI